MLSTPFDRFAPILRGETQRWLTYAIGVSLCHCLNPMPAVNVSPGAVERSLLAMGIFSGTALISQMTQRSIKQEDLANFWGNCGDQKNDRSV
jgi:hypothetical protein